MFFTKLRWAVLTVFAAVALTTGAGVIAGSRSEDKPGADQATEKSPPERNAKPEERPASGLDDHATIVVLERKIAELERRLEQLSRSRQDGSQTGDNLTAPKAGVGSDTVRKVRPRFECLVEKVCVKVGQTVKKGDPLAELFSSDLVAAKNAFLSCSLAADRDQKLYDLRKELTKAGAISHQLWFETQNDREKSRLALSEARDRLFVYGLSQPEIDSLKEEAGERKAYFTFRSPVDGTVIGIEAGAQDLSDPKSVIMVIGLPKP